MIPGLDADADITYARMGRTFGISAYKAERNLVGMIKMSFLPKLRRLQEVTWILDMDRVAAIGRELHNIDDDIYPYLDDALVELFTPRSPNQHLPDIPTIKRTLQEVLAQFYVTDTPDPADDRYRINRHAGRATIGINIDGFHAETIDRLVRQRAARDGTSFAAALVALILDPVDTTIVINTYQPEGSTMAFVPSYGYLNPDNELAKKFRTLRPGGNNSYTPSDTTRAFVEGRDGICRYPGCTVPAHNCQLDHRIEWDNGGPTCTDNLVALCAHHHNMKTDRRIFYILDPITGQIFWLFDDGTWETTHPQGPIGTTTTNWRLTIAERMDLIEGHQQRVRRQHQQPTFDD